MIENIIECNCNPRIDGKMTWHKGSCARVTLPKEAQLRIAAKVDSVKQARLHALAHSHETVIG